MGHPVFTVARSIGEGDLHPQDATDLGLGGGEVRAVGAHHGPGGAVVRRHFPGVGEHSQAIDVGDARGVGRDCDSFGRSGVTDHRLSCSCPSSRRSRYVAVGETENLNPPERIHTVSEWDEGANCAIVCDRDAVIGVPHHRVISLVATEHGNINTSSSRADFPHDAQLRGSDGSSQQAGLEGVDGARKFRCAVGVGEANAGIEIHISVDDVIAAATFDHV